MQCPQCQHENPAGQRFCGECGARVASVCPSCGTASLPGQKFCGTCGASLDRVAVPDAAASPGRSGGPPAASTAALDAERKQVTVLFADLKGSMELLADRDPEEARQILDPVLERMMEAVHWYEGTVNQVMGDGIMALFGAPMAQEDHAVRACHAALRMQASISKWAEAASREHGITTRIRVGLNSGEVVVGSFGSDLRMDYTAVGQTTHLAARMEQLASPGSILITPETLRLVQGHIAVRALGSMAVKGLEAPVPVYEVVGPGTAQTAVAVEAARRLTRFVGREAELAQLERALVSAARGRGQVISVIGEPGVGKSRLFFELTRSATAATCLVLHAGAVSYARTTAYRPIIELLWSYFGLHAVAATRVPETVRDRLTALDPTLLPLLPALGALLQPGDADPEWLALDRRERRQRTLDAVRRLLVREGERRPVCLVLEDLHWADSETRAVIESLIDSLPGARLLLLLNYRPEFQHAWATRSTYTQLRMEALAPEGARAVLDSLLGDCGELDLLKTLLIERTDRNPFFLEESVRTLVENHTLAGAPGDYRLTRAVQTVDVPSTVQAVLGARIDRLAADDKRLLQCAAVIGERVPAALLQAVADTAPEAVREGLTHLRAGEFLYERVAFPEREYRFKHGLMRRVAYGSLLQDRRRALHGRIVQYLEDRHGDRVLEHVETLADHARRGELWDRAARYLRQAGTKAFAHSANREAVTWFEQALEAIHHLADTAETRADAVDIHLGLRNALTPLGENERTLEHLHRAEALAEGLDDRGRLGRVLSFETNTLVLIGRHAQAIEVGRRACGVADALGDVPLRTATHLYLGRAHLWLGRFDQAVEILEGVVANLAGEQARDHLGLPILPAVFARSHLVECLVELGRFADSERYATEGLALAEARSHPDTLVWAYLGAGLHRLARGEVAAATTAFERAYEICRAHDMAGYEPRISGELALAVAVGGRAGDAVAMAQAAVEKARAQRQVVLHSKLLLRLGEVCLLAGRLSEARDAALQALERFRGHGEQGHEAWALRLLGDVAVQAGPREAGPLYGAARDLAATLRMAPLLTRCERALADLAGVRTAGAQPA